MKNEEYSMDQFCDYTTDRFNTAQPDMPAPSFVKQLWYGIGRIESLYQINNTTVAELQNGAYGSPEVVFTPYLNLGWFRNDRDVRIFARNHAEKHLRILGFETIVNTATDKSRLPDISVVVPLNTKRNINRMRIFGPYMLFDKRKMLTSAVLSQMESKTK